MAKKKKKIQGKTIIHRIKSLHEFNLKNLDLCISPQIFLEIKKISMKTKIKIPKMIKSTYCSTCGALLLTSKTRIKKTRIIKTCSNCGKIIRTPLVKTH